MPTVASTSAEAAPAAEEAKVDEAAAAETTEAAPVAEAEAPKLEEAAPAAEVTEPVAVPEVAKEEPVLAAEPVIPVARSNRLSLSHYLELTKGLVVRHAGRRDGRSGRRGDQGLSAFATPITTRFFLFPLFS